MILNLILTTRKSQVQKNWCNFAINLCTRWISRVSKKANTIPFSHWVASYINITWCLVMKQFKLSLSWWGWTDWFCFALLYLRLLYVHTVRSFILYFILFQLFFFLVLLIVFCFVAHSNFMFFTLAIPAHNCNKYFKCHR